jgi:hypothetical protein
MRSQRRRAIVWTLAVCAASATALAISKQRAWRRRWYAWSAAVNFIESCKNASEVALELTADTKAYVSGSSAEPPASLIRSLELLSSRPVVTALGQLAQRTFPSDGPSIVDTLVDASFTEHGQSLIALVASICTTRCVQVLTRWAEENFNASQPASESTYCDKLSRWLAKPQAHALISRCIIEFVSTGVRSYCVATDHINPYEQLLQAAAKPENLRALKTLTATFCESSVRACADEFCSNRYERNGPPCPISKPKNGIVHVPVRLTYPSSTPEQAETTLFRLVCVPDGVSIHAKGQENGCSRNPCLSPNGTAPTVDISHIPSSAGSPPKNHERCQPLTPPAHLDCPDDPGAAPTNGALHPTQPQITPVWLSVLCAAAASADVRRLCAEAAHAGCAGAVQAAADSFAEASSRLVNVRVQPLIMFGVALWSLILPLMLFYVLTCPIVVTQ